MAALAGVLFPDPHGDPEVVRRMLEAVPHRGSELEVASLGRCIVGVVNEPDRREATLAVRGGLIVAFTGVLDNPDEVARRLSPPNDTRRATSPSELVLAAFEESGESLLPSLRGNFGCLISDGRRLWAFRDQIGFESLFERGDSRGVYVATEAKQVLAGAGVAPEPDIELVEALFYGDVEDSTACPLRGVRRLLSGTLLAADGDSLTRRRYWDPVGLVETARLSPPEMAERFRELFAQAVRRTLTGSDVVALSGGIDSPPIAAFGSREHLRLFARPLPALAEVYPSHPSTDESHYIELVADRLDIPLHT
ncbi:MAG: asparagine synthase-related protein, partial [Gemmatimonadota bacterium]